jgi:hypothetical protein
VDDLQAAARSITAVVDAVDSGELDAPRWMRDRLRAAVVTVDAAMPPADPPGASEQSG